MRLAGGRLQHEPTRAGLTQPSKAGPVWTGEVRLNEAKLDEPLRWRRPRRIFVCAHGDLFHEGVPDAWIDQVFAVMALAEQHTFQVLTKRADRMRAYFEGLQREVREAGDLPDICPIRIDNAAADLTATHGGALDEQRWPLANVWLGVSVEDQPRAEERIQELLLTPAAIRYVSAEPLLSPIDLEGIHGALWYYREETGEPRSPANLWHPHGRGGLDWVIVGGESGLGARPMHPDWARKIRDDCAEAGVPFFFKQWGEFLPEGQFDRDQLQWRPGREDPRVHWWQAGRRGRTVP